MKNVVIYGTGQQAELAHYYFENELGRKVVAFTIDYKIEEWTKSGLPIVLLEDLPKLHDANAADVFVAISAMGMNLVRQQICKQVLSMGYELTNCISPRVLIPCNVEIGHNVFMDHATQVHPFVRIGNNFLGMGAKIGHHALIGDNVTVITATVGGNVELGNNCFIGIDATVCPSVRIGECALVDARAIVTTHLPAHAVVSGMKSRIRKVDSRSLKLLGRSYFDFSKMHQR